LANLEGTLATKQFANPIATHAVDVQHRKFESFDYGAEANQQRFGSATPLDYMAHYHLIDIPVSFCMGLDDQVHPSLSIYLNHSISVCLFA
jgi:hypothetical protein